MTLHCNNLKHYLTILAVYKTGKIISPHWLQCINDCSRAFKCSYGYIHTEKKLSFSLERFSVYYECWPTQKKLMSYL